MSTPLQACDIHGNWATLLLPIRPDDSIDFDLLAEELDHFIAAGVNGVYSNGSAGEFYTQSEDEFDRVSGLLAEKCRRSGTFFQIGLSHTSPQTALERLRRTKALNPSAYQVILPDWFPPTMPEILSFLERMTAEAAPIPLILYNPPHAKRRLVPAEWQILADQAPGVIGMKVPGGDENWYREMQPVMARLSTFIPGHFLAEGLAQGAHGAYSNVACLSPAGAQHWYDLCIADPPTGQALGARIAAFWTTHVAPIVTRDHLSNMAADKAAAMAGGWLPGFTTRLRWPYRFVAEAEAQRIGKAARAELPELFACPALPAAPAIEAATA